MKKTKKAFTLLELSLVILIISILMVGAMSASITSINKAKYKYTKAKIEKIYNAMGAYLLINKALPCPASLLNTKTSANYGVSGSAGDCNDIAGVYEGSTGNSTELVYGMVPIKALGLPSDMAEDDFGSRFTYIVSKKFTNPDENSSDSFTTVSPAYGFTSSTAGFISIREKIAGSNFYSATDDAIFAIISHGQNKRGAFNSNAISQNSASGSDALEQANFATSFGSGTNATAVFYASNNYLVSNAVNNDLFDDVVFYKTRNQILLDFNALDLVHCPAITSETYDRCTGGACDFPKARYNQIVASTTNCSATYDTTVAKPTKRCGAFGVWDDGYVNPCTE